MGWEFIYFPAWTLSFDLLFYLTFAVVLSIAGKRVNLICAIVLGLIATQTIHGQSDEALIRNGLLLEFVFGVLIAEPIRRKVVIPPSIGLVSLAGSIVAFVIAYKAMGAPRHLQWGIPAALLVIGALSFENARIFRHPLVMLGRSASYAIYLIHLTTIGFVVEFGRWHGIELYSYPSAASALGLVSPEQCCRPGQALHLQNVAGTIRQNVAQKLRIVLGCVSAGAESALACGQGLINRGR
jgi:exopolysaccharide production protein ExoZ